MKQYTFDDSDKLKETSNFITKYASGEAKYTTEQILEYLDLLLELIELHPRNNLNLCLCGGMESVFKLILSDQND